MYHNLFSQFPINWIFGLFPTGRGSSSDPSQRKTPPQKWLPSLQMIVFQLQQFLDLVATERVFWSSPLPRGPVFPTLVRACWVPSVLSNSMQPYGLELARLLCSWASPGKNAGVGCRAVFQGLFLAQGSNLSLWCISRWALYHLGSTTWETPLHLYHTANHCHFVSLPSREGPSFTFFSKNFKVFSYMYRIV